MTTTTNIILPYLEDTGVNGKKLFTPKEWTERFRHCTKETIMWTSNKYLRMIRYQPAKPGTRKSQKSDKTSSGAHDCRQ